MMVSRKKMVDRAIATLAGGAIGDAMGMPTQLLSPQRIAELYGRVQGFVAPIGDHPVSKGLAAGTITDDTEQTLLLGDVLLQSQDGFDHRLWIDALLAWEESIRARGGYDLLGPSTKRAIDAINAGVPPEKAGRYGDTNGAAMRIAPVGIMLPPSRQLVQTVVETCRSTHNTSIAIAAAAAVATVISYGLDGAEWRKALPAAMDAAKAAESQEAWVAGGRISARIAWAVSLAEEVRTESDAQAMFDLIGTSVASQESVPAAFAVMALADGNCWKAAVIAANLGGDTDTIGAIACSMSGACSGLSSVTDDTIANLKGFDPKKVRSLAEALVDRRLALQESLKVQHG